MENPPIWGGNYGAIGKWGPKFDKNVWKVQVYSMGNGRSAKKSVVFIDRDDEADIVNARSEIQKSLAFREQYPDDERMIKVDQWGNARWESKPVLYIVFPCGGLVSVRKIIQARNPFGFPLNFVAMFLREVLDALCDIHSTGEWHSRLTVGNLHYHIQKRSIVIGYGATAFEGDVPDDSASSTEDTSETDWYPLNRIGVWGKAPEADVIEQSSATSITKQKMDIWSVGIVALELSFGALQIKNRSKLLSIAKYIRDCDVLPKKWDEFRIGAHLKKKVRRANDPSDVAFLDFLKECFREDPELRNNAEGLRGHNFLQIACTMEEFVTLVIPEKTSDSC